MEDMKKEFDALMAETKQIVKDEIKNAFLEGAKAGSVSTCAVLYETFTKAGLEETNILFTLLKDIAQQNGCADLVEYINARYTATTDTTTLN